MSNENKHSYAIEHKIQDTRLDVFLSNIIDNESRSHIQKLIKSGNVTVNGVVKKGNYKLKENDLVEITMPEPLETNIKPECIPLDILYEDEDVIVVNKKQGMVVHPAPGIYTGTLVNALLYHSNHLSDINGEIRPGIVHRIDKDTSGVLVVAKNNYSHDKLVAQLKDHSMTREYIALTEGVIKTDIGKVDAPIARHPVDRIKMAVVQGGKEAITHYKVENRYKDTTLIKCNLETGRTHQIRVHMSYIGHPLVGDPVYGYKKQKYKLSGQMLHAHKLGFIHPSTEEYMEFSTPLPEYFKNLIEKLENCL